MKTEAYVLVQLGKTDEDKILRRLSRYKQVVEAHILFGEWDLIAKVRADHPNEVATFVMDKIRSLASVRLTSTLIVAK